MDLLCLYISTMELIGKMLGDHNKLVLLQF